MRRLGTFMALIVVALGFSSATQDIVIDAYRIESVSEDLQAMMSPPTLRAIESEC